MGNLGSEDIEEVHEYIMYHRELENKTTFFVIEPRAGHTYSLIFLLC